MKTPKSPAKSNDAPPPALVPSHVVDRWVNDLRRVVVGGQVSVMAEVGEYLIEHVYGGEAEALTKRRGKSASIAQLAERAEEFGMTAAGLTRAVPIALQVRALGKTLSSRLTMRQHRALLPVKEIAEKKQLAEEAVMACLTAGELSQKVRHVQKPHAGGRAKEPPARRVLGRMLALVEEVTAKDLQDGLDAISPAEARQQLANLKVIRTRLAQVERALAKARGEGR